MHKLVLLAEARKHLKDIARYTQKIWGIKQRKHYISQLKQAMELIAESPQIGPLREELHPDLRSFLKGKHTIYYSVTQDQVKIVAILHQSMDPVHYISMTGDNNTVN